MTSNVQHTDVGAYALGLLEDADRRGFEAHLATCASCQAELNEFSGMAQLLGEVRMNPPAAEAGGSGGLGGSAGPSGLGGPVPGRHAGPGPTGPVADPRSGPVVDLLRRKADADRSRRRGRTILAIAAGVILLAGGGAIGAVVIPDSGAHHLASPAQQLLMTGQRHSATDTRTKAAGVVALEAKGWGSHVALQLRNIRGPLECELVAVSKSGARRVIAGWSVPPKGYGVPGSPDPLLVHGSSSFKPDQLERFDVVILGGPRDGERLLSVPV